MYSGLAGMGPNQATSPPPNFEAYFQTAPKGKPCKPYSLGGLRLWGFMWGSKWDPGTTSPQKLLHLLS